MTPNSTIINHDECPAEDLLKLLAVKWVSRIFRYAVTGPVRFSMLMRNIPGANKQSLSSALDKMEDAGLIEKTVIKQKPLHIEYNLSEHGRSVINVYKTIATLSKPVAIRDKK